MGSSSIALPALPLPDVLNVAPSTPSPWPASSSSSSAASPVCMCSSLGSSSLCLRSREHNAMRSCGVTRSSMNARRMTSLLRSDGDRGSSRRWGCEAGARLCARESAACAIAMGTDVALAGSSPLSPKERNSDREPVGVVHPRRCSIATTSAEASRGSEDSKQGKRAFRGRMRPSLQGTMGQFASSCCSIVAACSLFPTPNEG